MRTIILVLICFLIIGCEKESISYRQDIEIDTFLLNNYLDDAKQLYVKEINADSTHPNYNIALLDSKKINKILSLFQAVYNLKSPESDTIFKVYKIHTLFCYSLNSIVLKVNTDAPEINNLSMGIIPTGDQQLDDLLITYKFDSVRLSYSYPSFPWLSVNTEESYNLIPIINAFEKLPSVLIAENNGGCFDGNNIEIINEGEKTTLDFSIGFGDCPAGCIYRKHWKFIIENQIAIFEKIK